MGFLDELKKMTRPYDDDDEFFDDEDEAIPVAEEPAPARPAQARPAQARPAAARRPAPAPKKSAFVYDEPSESERPAPSYAPRGDSRAAVARRLIDFLSGVAYAQDGKIRRVASATYIITPFNVDLMGDQLDDMESGEFHL